MNKTRLYELVQVVTVLVRANGTKVECLVFVRIGGWLLGCLSEPYELASALYELAF